MDKDQHTNGRKTQQGQQHLVVDFPQALTFNIPKRKARNDPDDQDPGRPFQKTDQHVFTVAQRGRRRLQRVGLRFFRAYS